MSEPVRSAAELLETIAALERKIARHAVAKQDLYNVKNRLDAELDRFRGIQSYLAKAHKITDPAAFPSATLESVIEAFEFETALFLRCGEHDNELVLIEQFGLEQATEVLVFDPAWLKGDDAFLAGDGHALIEAWGDLGLLDAIIAPYQNNDGEFEGVIVGARTIDGGEYYSPISKDLISAFTVMVQNAGWLLVNRELTSSIEARNKELRSLTTSYSRFVPFEFLELLGKTSIQEIEPSDFVHLDMTVLFADLRRFTTLAEALGPEAVFALLNEYLWYMEPPITNNGGFINQYQGDAIMALFPGDADDALRACVLMNKALSKLNTVRQRREEPALQMGVGLHHGSLMLGAIGGRNRLDSNVVGDTANLASRAEGLTKIYGVNGVITDSVCDKLCSANLFELRELDRVVVKGRTTPIGIFEVLDLDPPEVLDQKLGIAERFNEGLALYRAARFPLAIAAFGECLSRAPLDPVSKMYVGRCAALLGAPPGPDWQGVTVLDQK